jgi:hypothetical protein
VADARVPGDDDELAAVRSQKVRGARQDPEEIDVD